MGRAEDMLQTEWFATQRSRKGEDVVFTLEHGNFRIFGVLDGHNGVSAALYVRDNLPSLFLEQVGASEGLHGRDRVARALATAFVLVNSDYCSTHEEAGSTATATC